MRRAHALAPSSLAVALLLSGCAHRSPDPSDLYNQQAALSSTVPIPALDWKVITSSVDRQHGTMSTLTGNDIAVQSARTANSSSYPAGAILAFITWAQRDDPHWFGGRIPAHPQSIETVTITSGNDGHPSATYAMYTGTPMTKLPQGEQTAASARTTYILGQRASVMP
ncbi:cytochrome P460 family protein [Granulicella arctica]|uniref:Cytochrome P460 domain-containing protein n=1 Tax=Granulicella arctica TaxID=940613 RepID=A0A7Y9PI56_9BACT|nr:cytochrome P460 family protein [Granulicella arctica]NYF79548.1 hypothetical protein [Granulicella arctica]